MDKSKIAAQLYTLRDFLKTPEDIAKSMKKVKEIGFDAVQISGMGAIEESELVKILDGEGLTCCATHESGQKIVEEPEAIVERLNKLNCKYTAYPFPHNPLKTKEDFQKLAKELTKSGKVLKDNGMVLTYHNHAVEFECFGDCNGLDIIYGESDPVCLQGEIDTYWVQHGGGNPVEWCLKLKNRLPLLHLKEFGIIDGKITMLEIGSGNLDWKSIIAAAKVAGTEWFIIEQDICRIDPFDSLKMSLEYLINEV
jgi:sugar phosphate isomerase/epimerase